MSYSKFPFEIPKAIEKDVLAKIAEANPPWADLDEWAGSDNEPTAFGYFCCWRYRTENLIDNLRRVIEEMRPQTYETEHVEEQWNACDGALEALRARLIQFGGLLVWAEDTWRYDPEILDCAKSESRRAKGKGRAEKSSGKPSGSSSRLLKAVE